MSNDKKILAKRFFLDTILCVFLLVFLINGYKLFVWATENYQSDKIMEDLNSNNNESGNGQVIIIPPSSNSSDTTSDTGSSSSSNESSGETSSDGETSSLSKYDIIYQTLYKDFTGLKARNTETKGWIKVAGLQKLDYPFVQNKDDTYYLYHDFDKKWSSAGWVFADNDVNFKNWNPNSLFLGHSRNNGTMFGSLHRCFERPWYSNASNHYVFITTEEDELIFQVFSVYHTNIYSGYDRQAFTYEQQFAKFIEDAVSRNEVSAVDYGASTDDIVITLTTCNGGVGTTERVALHAKLVYSKNDPSLESYKYEFKEMPEVPTLPSGTPLPSYLPTLPENSSSEEQSSSVESSTEVSSNESTATSAVTSGDSV